MGFQKRPDASPGVFLVMNSHKNAFDRKHRFGISFVEYYGKKPPIFR
jgi:hypothetical protein